MTFWRRLTRDLREHRKPPLVLVRRGLALLRDQRRVVANAVAQGCEPVTPDEAFAAVAAACPAAPTGDRAGCRAASPGALVQPDQRSCGAAVLVVARMLLDRGYAELLATGRHPAPASTCPARCGPVPPRGAGDAPPGDRASGRGRAAAAAVAARARHAAVGGGPPAVRHGAPAGGAAAGASPVRGGRGRGASTGSSRRPRRGGRSRSTSATAGCRGTWCS